MQIQVTRVTVKPKVFENSGDIAWGVQHTDNQWYDLFQERKPEKGEVIECDVKVIEKNGRTYRNAHPKPSTKQVERAKEVLSPVVTANKPLIAAVTQELKESIKEFNQKNPFPAGYKTRSTPYTQSLESYDTAINHGLELAALNGITDDAARVSLAAIYAIALGEGKLSLGDLVLKVDDSLGDKPEDDWPSDRDWTDGPPTVEQSTNAAIDKEMAAARARMDKFVKTDNTDYKTKLGVAIKEYCASHKLDFQSSKLDVLWRCAETRSLESLSQEQAKIAIVQLGKLL